VEDGSPAIGPNAMIFAVRVNMLALAILVAGSPPAGGSLPLNPVADVPLPGRASRFD